VSGLLEREGSEEGSMKDFQVQYKYFFQGARVVEVCSTDKASAVIDAKKKLEEQGDLFGGNIDTTSFRVVAQREIGKPKWKEVRS
jgi:hypothetical protein